MEVEFAARMLHSDVLHREQRKGKRSNVKKEIKKKKTHQGTVALLVHIPYIMQSLGTLKGKTFTAHSKQ